MIEILNDAYKTWKQNLVRTGYNTIRKFFDYLTIE
jgi:hypothetical protein